MRCGPRFWGRNGLASFLVPSEITDAAGPNLASIPYFPPLAHAGFLPLPPIADLTTSFGQGKTHRSSLLQYSPLSKLSLSLVSFAYIASVPVSSSETIAPLKV